VRVEERWRKRKEREGGKLGGFDKTFKEDRGSE
jgi:hypothetical protein